MKLKLLFIQITCLSLSPAVFAQWERTNVSTFNAETVYGICEHNGSLFGAINSKGLIKWNTTTQAWDSVGVTGFTFNDNSVHIDRIKSSGNDLYAFVGDQLCASTMVYKSSDNGANFVADTSGLPLFTCNDQPGTIHDVFVLDGRLIAIMGAGNWSKMPSDPTWVKNVNAATQFSEDWGNYGNSWYAWGNYKLQVSSDEGQTWSQPANANIPTMFLARLLNVNSETGRIYIAGSSLTTGVYKMLYTDDEGGSWDSIPIHQALGTSWIGQPQTVLDMISKGNFMELMLVNDANNSHADVIKSEDGGQTFQVDTVGLQSNAFGTIAVRTMIFFNDELFLAPNFFDVYRKGGIAGIAPMPKTNGIQIYPNPFKDQLNMNSEEPIVSLELMDLQGALIRSFTSSDELQKTSLEFLQGGVYLLKVKTVSSQSVVRLVKE